VSPLTNQLQPGLGGVPETLLIPLWARAEEQRRNEPLLTDPESVRLVESLDYDFGRFRRTKVEVENFCIRARVMDQLASKILDRPSGRRNVIEFGPGLDTRCFRIGANAPRWLEVDLPEVISLREKLLPPEGNRATFGGSMLDDTWIQQTQQSFDEPPLFIAEGVFYFFSQQQIQDLLAKLSHAFPGSDLIFDAVSSWYLKLANFRHPLTASRLQFCLRSNAADIVEWNPRYQISDYIGFGDSPAYDGMMERFPMWKRIVRKVCPFSRHAFMVVHVHFPNAEPPK
jgi:O-methyltransferase involved in polyketide biosynthesis